MTFVNKLVKSERGCERESGRLCNYTGASEMYRVFTFVVKEIGISF